MQILSFIKYLFVAQVLKLFSSSKSLKKIYRLLGNKYAQKNHSIISKDDISNGNWLVANIKRYLDTSKEELNVLELGTGWVHFYSLYLKMFLNTKIDMFDIVDNRQFNALKKRFELVEKALVLNEENRDVIERIKKITMEIQDANSFDDLYKKLNIKYYINKDGGLNDFENEIYDVIFSVDVLEHIPIRNLEKIISETHRLLRPGGLTIHQVGIDDHLSHYSKGMPSKNYLRYSTKIWNLFFNNDLQYINRLQFSDYLYLFSKQFKPVSIFSKIDKNVLINFKVSNEFLHYNNESILGTRAYLVFQKK